MRTFAAMLGIAALVLTPALARGARAAVVPPGQEDLVAEMLGRGEDVGPGCRLTAVDIEPTRIEGAYACQGQSGEARVALTYPSSSSPPAARTTREFVLSARSAPESLLVALEERIRAREAAWRWATAADGAPEGERSAPGRARLAWLPLAASCLAMMLVAGAAAARARWSS
jgi:hypothetical protein